MFVYVHVERAAAPFTEEADPERDDDDANQRLRRTLDVVWQIRAQGDRRDPEREQGRRVPAAPRGAEGCCGPPRALPDAGPATT